MMSETPRRRALVPSLSHGPAPSLPHGPALRSSKGPGWAIVLSLVIAVSGAFAQEQAQPSGDERFIQSLADRYNTQPVDSARLARLFFSVASTLDGGKSTVQFLRSRLAARDLARQALTGTIEEMYTVYEAQVGAFRASSERLLDDPTSRQKLFRVLMDGHRSCWELDRYTGMLETYGVSATDLMSVLSSTEACDRFRRAAFQGRVQDLVAAALSSDTEQAEEIEDLREELTELQKLLDDLRAIDEN